jgi:hypothetical protein
MRALIGSVIVPDCREVQLLFSNMETWRGLPRLFHEASAAPPQTTVFPFNEVILKALLETGPGNVRAVNSDIFSPLTRPEFISAIQISELSAIAPAIFGTAHPYEEIVFTRVPAGLKYFTEEPEEIVNPVTELSKDLLNTPLLNKKSELISLTAYT